MVLLAFLAGTGGGDQLTDWDRDLDGETACFLGAGSGDPETDLDEERLLGSGLGDSFFSFFGSGVLDTRRIGLVLGDGDCCLLGGEDDGPLLCAGGLSELRAALGRGEGDKRFGCRGERASLPDLLGEDTFLCLDGTEGDRLFPPGDPLCFGGGECETLCFDGGGDCDTLRFEDC